MIGFPKLVSLASASTSSNIFFLEFFDTVPGYRYKRKMDRIGDLAVLLGFQGRWKSVVHLRS